MKTPEATIGRQRESVVVGRFLEDVEKDGAVLVVTGQVGVGKSHLLRAAVAASVARGIAGHASRGVQYESTLRFAALNQLLLPLRHEFGHLGRAHRELLDDALGLGRRSSSADVATVAEAVISLLDRLTRAEPVLLTIDDLHWLDSASWAVVAAVARSMAGIRAGLLTSVCADSHTDFDLTGLPTCRLRPLQDSAALDLLENRFPAIDGPLRERVIAEAQGNPLMLSELPKLLEQDGRPPGARVPDVLPINGRLRNAFGPRLAALPASTRRVLLLAALGFDRAAGRGPTDPLQLGSSELDRLAPAVAARLVDLDERSGHVTFRHPLIRATVAALSTSAERRDAHRALAERHAGEDDRVRHLARVTLHPDEQLARELEQVAHRRVHQGNGFGAIEDLRHSADLTPRGSDRARRLAQASCIGSDLAGNLRHAGSLMTEAREIDPEAGESLRAAVAEARGLLHVEGDVDGAHALLVEGVRVHAHRCEIDEDHIAEALYLLADICAYSGRPELGKPLQEELARLGKDTSPHLTALTGLLGPPGRLDPARLKALDATVESMVDTADPGTIGATASVALLTDQVGSMRGALWRVARAGRAGGPCSPVVTALAALAADSFLGGRWDESTFIGTEGETYSNRHDYQLASRGFQLDRALVAAARGRDDVVQDVTAAVGRWAAPRGALLLQQRCHRVRALIALGRGDFEGAYQHALAVSPAGRVPGYRPLALAVTLELVEAAVRTNRRAAAADHIRSLQLADIAASSPRLAMITAASAGIAAEQGALDHFEAALAVDGVDRWPFDLARVQLYYGERLRRMRAPTEARAHLAAALGTFTRLGAVRWEARARKELDAAAMVKSGGGSFGRGSLTPQEREVALLAAEGLTNKSIAMQLFISPRTVGAHLNHVFPKLGITTRASLRDALQAHPLAQV